MAPFKPLTVRTSPSRSVTRLLTASVTVRVLSMPGAVEDAVSVVSTSEAE